MIPVLATVQDGDLVAFIVGAALAGIGALVLVTARNAVHAAGGFAVTVFGIAVLFVEQNAHLLAGLEVLLGIGAVASMFMLVSMYVDADHGGERQRPDVRRSIIVLAGAGLAALLLALVDWSFNHTGKPSTNEPLSGASNDASSIAHFIFTGYPVALLAIGALALLVALIAVTWTATFPDQTTADVALSDAPVESEGVGE